ncbi:MAG: LLM class flavin-dependent oxidoreductase [Moorea sp. SIO1G6]|uniref:LLM class flavin-dependent oxidoreductase n=1 Tax=Moorena sp. SIO1G6 TaxID=2607840 RepID=UPI0013C22A70|nr:LLM class flavin-dependent oxidoreductase [Moorena sp. SIO1G6]NET63381.1 LLM class flavin-dependent oxidoreductase [Moorena sp. SIO1G6]
MNSLRFHWRLAAQANRLGVVSQDAKLQPSNSPEQQVNLPDIENNLFFCRRAEEIGIDSLLTAFGYYRPDPIILSTALAMATETIKFMVAYRPGAISPTLFVQQINTLSALSNGRVSLNVIMGHSQKEQGYYGDFLEHDQRYQRAEEFLEICQGLWQQNGGFTFKGTYYHIEEGQVGTPFVAPERNSPEIYIGGGSPGAQELAVKQGNCWLLLFDTPDKLRPRVKTIIDQGIEVGLRGSIIARPTREEAIEAAYSLIKTGNKQWIDQVFVKNSDFQSIKFAYQEEADGNWLTPWLWKGAVPAHGPSSMALVGSPIDIAEAIMEYKKMGCSQFIFSGWPELETMTYFGKEILPLVREMEKISV